MHTISKITAALGAALFLFAGPAMAEHHEKAMPDEAAMKKMMEAMAPGEAHKKLTPLVGKWNYTMTFRMSADAPEQTASGTSENKWILDGRQLKQHVNGKMTMDEQPMEYEGIGYMGYNNVKKQYESVWMDNMNTAIATGTGSFDDASNTLTEKVVSSCAMKGGEVTYRSKLHIVDNSHYTYTMTDIGGDKEYDAMKIEFTKQ